MEFSVLMSVYKNDNMIFFQQAIESVTINQTLKPTQVVIVKDGPIGKDFDNLIEEYANNSIDIKYTIIEKQKNKGLASALNTGLVACEYEWIARMDSDDISLPDRFEKQVCYIENNRSVSVLGGVISEFENDPSIIVSKRIVPNFHIDLLKYVRTRNPMNHVTVFYKKQDVINVGGYSENFGKLEDYKLWVDLLISGKRLHNLSDVLVNVRIGNGFIERRSNKREIIDWDMLQYYLLQAGIVNNYKAFLNRIYIRIFIYIPSNIKKFLYKNILRK